jgi:hypothetical protein
MLEIDVISFFYKHVFVVFLSHFSTKKKLITGGRAEFIFFLLIAFQILHVFLPDMSVHRGLIKYTYL